MGTDHPDLSGGSADAELTRLYDAHARGLWRYLARRLGAAAADDLVAETFLAAWESRRRYDPARASARAWLYGIATNLVRRHARTEAAALRAMTREAARAGVSAPEDVASVARVDAGRAARAIAAQLADLRQEERDVLLLVAWAGLAPVEIAAVLDLDPATVRSRLHRARTRLRGSVTKEESE